MNSYARNARGKKYRSPRQVNLVSARSNYNTEIISLSRTHSAEGYAKTRKKRIRKKSILLATGITLASLLAAAVVTIAIYALIVNDRLGTNSHGERIKWDSSAYRGVFIEPETDEFWVLLLGIDERDRSSGIPRTDTIILVRVDLPNKKLALISIPRDTYVSIPGHGKDKINAAYTYGELNQRGGGIPLVAKTVSEFAGIDIAYFAMVNFDDFEKLVDSLGGVEVDVPVDIIGDRLAGDVDIHSGLQTLNGEAALTFVRSRQLYNTGDYQRMANQRTFLQAMTKKVLSDPSKITSTITSISSMTLTNMDLMRIISIAMAMQGMKENAIHTYHVPSMTDWVGGTSYVVAYDYLWNDMIKAIESGNYPPPQQDKFAGVIPESYVAIENPAADRTAGKQTNIKTGDYIVDVRNGCGVPGSARSISDMLHIAGYGVGNVSNMNAFIYETTLIIYKSDKDKAVAEDIKQRIGYGRIIASNGAYDFSGNILVVVGNDYYN